MGLHVTKDVINLNSSSNSIFDNDEIDRLIFMDFDPLAKHSINQSVQSTRYAKKELYVEGMTQYNFPLSF